MKNTMSIFFLGIFVVMPGFVFAAVTNFDGLVGVLSSIIGQVIVLIAALALLVFFWGIFKFISNAGDATKIEEGRRFMLWGIIGFFVMMSVWGIVQVVYNTFFEGVEPTIPPTSL
jgi:membrane protease YdiL (CAAX protease family)